MPLLQSYMLAIWLAICCVVYAGTTPLCRPHDDGFYPDEILRVSRVNVTNGCIERNTAVVNGTVPGPPLVLPQGKIVWIRVYNDMTNDNLTMHWHGLSEAAAPFSDGTPQASQWPIPPGHFFDYELDLSSIGAGTYFYHSHVFFQTASANGPLIVTDPGVPPYQYDEEKTFHMTDVFNQTDEQIYSGLVGTPFAWSGETNAVLFNGIGVTTTSQVTPGSGCGIETVNVSPDTTYRFRFIGATALSFLSMAFEKHENLTVIEADGAYTQPYSVDFLQFASGQRYDVLFKTKTCEELAQEGGKLQYYIQTETRERPTNTTAYAILNYADTCGLKSSQKPLSTKAPPKTKPLTLPPTDLSYLDYVLRPLKRNNFPTAAEVTRRIYITVQQVAQSHVYWQENMYSWTPNNTVVPYLVALYKDEKHFLPNYTYALQHDGVDDRVGAFPAKLGEVLEIVWVNQATNANGGFDVHPFHAHGKHFYDIGSGNGTYDPVANEKKLMGTQPVLRDTTMLYRYNESGFSGQKLGWRAWRLRVEDAGVFMIHCHTLQHSIMGMQTVWVFGNTSDIYAKVPTPEVQGYLKYGGDVYGNETHAPQVLHYFNHDA